MDQLISFYHHILSDILNSSSHPSSKMCRWVPNALSSYIIPLYTSLLAKQVSLYPFHLCSYISPFSIVPSAYFKTTYPLVFSVFLLKYFCSMHPLAFINLALIKSDFELHSNSLICPCAWTFICLIQSTSPGTTATTATTPSPITLPSGSTMNPSSLWSK